MRCQNCNRHISVSNDYLVKCPHCNHENIISSEYSMQKPNSLTYAVMKEIEEENQRHEKELERHKKEVERHDKEVDRHNKIIKMLNERKNLSVQADEIMNKLASLFTSQMKETGLSVTTINDIDDEITKHNKEVDKYNEILQMLNGRKDFITRIDDIADNFRKLFNLEDNPNNNPNNNSNDGPKDNFETVLRINQRTG